MRGRLRMWCRAVMTRCATRRAPTELSPSSCIPIRTCRRETRLWGLSCRGHDLDEVLKQVEEDATQLMETALSFDEAFAQGVALPESAFCAELGVKLCSDEHIRGDTARHHHAIRP